MTNQLPLFDKNGKPSLKLIDVVEEQVLEPISIDKDHTHSQSDLLPEDFVFAFTNNYTVSGTLLGRLLQKLEESEILGVTTTRDLIASELAIPRERIVGLFNFARKTELVSRSNTITMLGKQFLLHDMYFLNRGGLWFLHYLTSSNANIVIWSRLFNYVFYKKEVITPIEAIDYYTDIRRKKSLSVFREKGSKEIANALRTYADDLFKSLRFVIRIDKGEYTILGDEFSISPLIWMASILVYRDRYYPGSPSLEAKLIIDAHFSPGRLFHQKEEIVREVLDDLHNRGLLTVERRQGLDQVRFKNDITWLGALRRYFEEKK